MCKKISFLDFLITPFFGKTGNLVFKISTTRMEEASNYFEIKIFAFFEFIILYFGSLKRNLSEFFVSKIRKVQF